MQSSVSELLEISNFVLLGAAVPLTGYNTHLTLFFIPLQLTTMVLAYIDDKLAYQAQHGIKLKSNLIKLANSVVVPMCDRIIKLVI